MKGLELKHERQAVRTPVIGKNPARNGYRSFRELFGIWVAPIAAAVDRIEFWRVINNNQGVPDLVPSGRNLEDKTKP